jgi:hypothetical protein
MDFVLTLTRKLNKLKKVQAYSLLLANSLQGFVLVCHCTWSSGQTVDSCTQGQGSKVKYKAEASAMLIMVWYSPSGFHCVFPTNILVLLQSAAKISTSDNYFGRFLL